jgi:biotin transport system substrate-specific component
MYDARRFYNGEAMEKAGSIDFGWKEEIRNFSIIQIVGASLFIGLSAQIRIPLFFTPIPLTGQTLAVMLIGAFLGSRNGALAVLCYLLQGCMGMPVWAGGHAGLIAFAGPSGGYLIGFVLQAYLIGLLFEHKKAFGRIPAFIKILAPSLIQLTIGTLWLAKFTDLNCAWMLGFYPFIIGELLKTGITVAILKKHEHDFCLLR